MAGFDPIQNVKDLFATVSTGYGFLAVFGTIIILSAAVGLAVKFVNGAASATRTATSFLR